MVTVNQIERGLANWLDQEVVPTLSFNGQYGALKRGAVVAAATLAVKKTTTMLTALATSPAAALIGLSNEGGEIDIEGYAEEFRKQMPASGYKVSIPYVAEITFTPADVETLLRYINNA